MANSVLTLLKEKDGQNAKACPELSVQHKQIIAQTLNQEKQH
jgi:hypothetical protein